jgi:hypothetical protein
MLVATHQKRTQRNFPPQLRTSREAGEVVRHKLIDLLANVANWPSIDALMHNRSLAMIAGQGIPVWLGFGGRIRADGLLSFGNFSDVASRVLAERRASRDGFLWVDESGTAWAVLPPLPGPDDEDRPAFALSWNGIAWPLDPGARRWALCNLAARMARASRPGRVWTQSDRIKFAGWARTRRQLQLVDLAMRFLDRLGARQGGIEFGAGDMASDNTAPDADEIFDAIRAATELKIAHLSLAPLGWHPRIIRQSSAVSEVERIGPETFRLHFAPLWCQAIAGLSGAAPRTVPSDSVQRFSDC